jgi:hypothetical protein
MIRALAVLMVLALQEDRVAPLIRTLESAGDVRKTYHAVADLAALGDPALPAIEKRLQGAEGRSRELLQLAADEIRSVRMLTGVPPARRLSMKSADRNVIELLNDLRSRTGVALTLENLMGDEKLPEVPIDIQDATMLEAFDAICRAGNVTLTMEGGQLNLYPGDYADLPRFFYDHYFYRLQSFVLSKQVDFRRPAVQWFRIQMEMLWNPAAAPCRIGAPVVVEARDDKGKSLLPPPAKKEKPEEPPKDVPEGVESAIDQQAVHPLELLPPSPGAQKLAVLRGFRTISLPKDKMTVTFAEDSSRKPPPDGEALAAPLEGLVRTSGDFTVKIAKVEPSLFRIACEVTSKTLKAEDISKMPFMATVVLKGGEATRAYANPWSTKEGVAEVMIGFQPLSIKEVLVLPGGEDRPAPAPVVEKLEFSIVTAVQERKIPFEFREVKLK